MGRFVLQPAKLRGTFLVDDRRQESLTLNWQELLTKLCPSNERMSAMKLRGIQPGAYVGLTKSAVDGRLVNFLLLNPDRSGNLSNVLQADPSFETRLVSAYRVVETVWDANTTEIASGRST